MKIRHKIALLAVLSLAGVVQSAHAADIAWEKSVSKAQKMAKTQKKPLMVDTYTTWCYWCKKLDESSFKDAKVVKLSKSFVPLKIDAEAEGAKLAEKYEVDGYPTILFIDANGKLLKRIGGYVEGPELAKEMQSVLTPKKAPAAKPTPKPTPKAITAARPSEASKLCCGNAKPCCDTAKKPAVKPTP
jgi:thiol:disulfide interchange protein